ncbi:MAG: peptidoglycan DD-metalloendopeptidase family protein [Chitinispirillaceae bacterium]|nr:peptidoglycan DD-metalloendopeptidase family protein [Chitinispirillaceae bacterium]
MKIRYHVILLSVCCVTILNSCSSGEYEFENSLHIDPGEIPDSLLQVVLTDKAEKTAQFEQLFSSVVESGQNLRRFYDIVFRYRDSRLLPLYYRILTSESEHPFFRAAAITVIGETGNGEDFEKLLAEWKTERNDLVREYLANALGKTADSSRLPQLTGLAEKERNGYVRKTLEAAIDRASGGRRVKIAYLPLFDTTRYRRLKTFPSESPRAEFSLTARKKLSPELSQFIPMVKDRLFPHMQYKQCRSIYEKVGQPFSSFGLAGVDHVGEDSGWLFEGMPVHAVTDGRVALIQHEESWGCLVGIESVLEDYKQVCIYYGHLSANPDVYLGKIVEAGDKIGEIGPSFSFQNGGYRAHLHLGIEKASIADAVIAGYHEKVDHWYDPMAFIGGSLLQGKNSGAN